MTTYYLGQTSDGRVVSRKSKNPLFTHAAMQVENVSRYGLPNFSTSADKARALFVNGFGRNRVAAFEVVELRKVDATEFRAATKGVDPTTGRLKADSGRRAA